MPLSPLHSGSLSFNLSFIRPQLRTDYGCPERVRKGEVKGRIARFVHRLSVRMFPRRNFISFQRLSVRSQGGGQMHRLPGIVPPKAIGMRLRGPKDECKDEYQGWRVEWPSRYQAKQPGPAQTYNQFNRCTQKAINITAHRIHSHEKVHRSNIHSKHAPS